VAAILNRRDLCPAVFPAPPPKTDTPHIPPAVAAPTAGPNPTLSAAFPVLTLAVGNVNVRIAHRAAPMKPFSSGSPSVHDGILAGRTGSLEVPRLNLVMSRVGQKRRSNCPPTTSGSPRIVLQNSSAAGGPTF